MRVRALNKYGWSTWGGVVTIGANRVPGNAITVTTSNQTTYLEISWTLPNKFSADLTEYKIEVKKKGSSTWTANV